MYSTYKVILIPKFNAKAMSARKDRKIQTKAVQGKLCRSNYKFRQSLIKKIEFFSHCKVIVCDESYTCNTCGCCSVINDKLGSSKVLM